MPPIDVLMILFWLGFVLVGTLSGSIRQLLLLLSLFAAAVIAGTTNSYAGAALHMVAGDTYSQQVSEGYMMFFLFLLCSVVFFYVLSSTWKETRPLGRNAHVYDTVLGGLLGVACGLLFVVAMYASLAFATQNPWPNSDSTRVTLAGQVSQSVLQPAIEEKIPAIYSVLRPFFPRGIPGFPVF